MVRSLLTDTLRNKGIQDLKRGFIGWRLRSFVLRLSKQDPKNTSAEMFCSNRPVVHQPFLSDSSKDGKRGTKSLFYNHASMALPTKRFTAATSRNPDDMYSLLVQSQAVPTVQIWRNICFGNHHDEPLCQIKYTRVQK